MAYCLRSEEDAGYLIKFWGVYQQGVGRVVDVD